METAKVGTDVAGVRSVFAGEEAANVVCAELDVDAGQCAAAAAAAAAPPAVPGAPSASAGIPEGLPLVMSDVVIIDGVNREADPDERLLEALNSTLRRPPTEEQLHAPRDETEGLFCRRSEEPVNEFSDNKELLVCAFPHLFPFGVGVPRSSLSTNFTRYLMLHHSNVFANEPRFYFLLFNQLHRHTNCRSTSLRVKAQKKHIDAVTRITKAPDFMARLEAANSHPESPDAKRLMRSLHPHIITLGAKTPFSPASRKASFNHFLAALNRSAHLPNDRPHLRSLTVPVLVRPRFGTGQLFITMAFNEVSGEAQCVCIEPVHSCR
jgi:hypothetical protein